MATIRSRNGKYQAQVRRQGQSPLSKTFIKKSDAQAWARKIESEYDRGELYLKIDPELKLSELIIRYRDTITPRKRGAPQETRRLDYLLKQDISKERVSSISTSTISEFRDERIKDGERACHYDLVLLQGIFKAAKNDWGIPIRENPVENVKKPPPSKARTRRLEEGELDRIIAGCDGVINEYLLPMILFAIETAMRRSEILNANWGQVDFEKITLHIPVTKNGHPRTIPLTDRALELLLELKPDDAKEDDHIFCITDNAVKLSWNRLKNRLQLEDLRFHDLRHESISRFFEMGLSVPEVALISGHRDYKMLFRYTHLRAEDVGKKIREK